MKGTICHVALFICVNLPFLLLGQISSVDSVHVNHNVEEPLSLGTNSETDLTSENEKGRSRSTRSIHFPDAFKRDMYDFDTDNLLDRMNFDGEHQSFYSFRHHPRFRREAEGAREAREDALSEDVQKRGAPMPSERKALCSKLLSAGANFNQKSTHVLPAFKRGRANMDLLKNALFNLCVGMKQPRSQKKEDGSDVGMLPAFKRGRISRMPELPFFKRDPEIAFPDEEVSGSHGIPEDDHETSQGRERDRDERQDAILSHLADVPNSDMGFSATDKRGDKRLPSLPYFKRLSPSLPAFKKSADSKKLSPSLPYFKRSDAKRKSPSLPYFKKSSPSLPYFKRSPSLPNFKRYPALPEFKRFFEWGNLKRIPELPAFKRESVEDDAAATSKRLSILPDFKRSLLPDFKRLSESDHEEDEKRGLLPDFKRAEDSDKSKYARLYELMSALEPDQEQDDSEKN